LGKGASHLNDADEIVKDLSPRLKARDVVLVMSNGGFGGIHQKLLDALGRTAGG
jgi:UDP-N-acetylmuramate: L-alanyl-gamma-D-glutamyl-meso-diaminopimelate ligase